MRTRLSLCKRKARFKTSEAATAFAQAVNPGLRCYRCDRCCQFHLTSRTKGKRTPPRAS